jgi:uncharacterized protein with NRDE domain
LQTRPTRDAQIEPATDILCGRDLSAGGTWCGVQVKTGDLAVLTNVFDPNAKPLTSRPLSRGKVVESFIQGEYERRASNAELIPHWEQYMGFNMIFGNLNRFAREQQKV